MMAEMTIEETMVSILILNDTLRTLGEIPGLFIVGSRKGERGGSHSAMERWCHHRTRKGP